MFNNYIQDKSGDNSEKNPKYKTDIDEINIKFNEIAEELLILVDNYTLMAKKQAILKHINTKIKFCRKKLEKIREVL